MEQPRAGSPAEANVSVLRCFGGHSIVGAVVVVLALCASPALAGEPVAKWCSGVKVAAFPGGPKDDAFAKIVEAGFRQAELDLGPTLTYAYSDWNPNTLIAQIDQALGSKVDGIAAYGFAGDAATESRAERLFAEGGVFTSLDVPLPKLAARFAGKGFGYVGAPNYKAGAALATEAAVRAKLGKGDTVLVWGVRGKGGERAQRTIGVADTLAKAGMKVVYHEIDEATLQNPDAGLGAFTTLMKANPSTKLVITDQGSLTADATTLGKAAGLEPGKVFFAGFELTAASARAITEGYQNLVLDQQPFLQGYLSVLDICLAKKFGFQGLDVTTAGAFVDKGNVEAISALMAKGIR